MMAARIIDKDSCSVQKDAPSTCCVDAEVGKGNRALNPMGNHTMAGCLHAVWTMRRTILNNVLLMTALPSFAKCLAPKGRMFEDEQEVLEWARSQYC